MISTLFDNLTPELDKHINPIARAINGLYELPNVFVEALKRGAKYLVLKGGRGSGKTFAVIATMIEESYLTKFKKCTFLVIRELIGSLDGVRETIVDLITQAGLEEDFKFTSSEIINLKTKCKFKFRGLRSTAGKTQLSQLNKIKGLHKIAKVFGEEAQDLTADSLDVLLPTVNRGGKIKVKGQKQQDQIDVQWLFCMNPNKKRDPVIEKVETQKSHEIIHVNIFDIEEKYQDKQLLEQAASEEGQLYYKHVWLGEEFAKVGGYPFANIDLIRTNDAPQSFAFLDPSFAGGDFTALSFAANYGGKLLTWGMCWRESWNHVKEEIVDLLKEHNCVSFYYESNSLGDTPQEIFADYGIDAQPWYSLGNKHARIYRGAHHIEGKALICTNKSNDEYVKNVLDYSDEAANDDAPDSLVSNLMAHDVIDYRKAA